MLKHAILLAAIALPTAVWADGAIVEPGEHGYSRTPPAYEHLEPRVIEKHTRIVEPPPIPRAAWYPYPQCPYWDNWCSPPVFFDDDDFHFRFHGDRHEFGEFHEHGHEFGGHFGGGGFHGGFGGHMGGGHGGHR
jgi:hypothetical protein